MKSLIFLFILFVSFQSFSQTSLSGGIYTSEIWTLSGSPYIVSGNLVVFEGVDIIVEPGVSVLFNQSAALELRGTLTAIGSASDSITFSSNVASPTTGIWDGIMVIGSTNPLGVGNQVTMEYVKGMYAETFVNLDIAYHGPYNFKHCYFAYNGIVNRDGGMPATNFDYCMFKSNFQGLEYCQFDSRASHCQFIDNYIGLEGIHFVDTCYFNGNSVYAMAPYGVTTGCTVENNAIGVKASFNAVNHTFVNNTLESNDIGIQIASFFNGSITFTGNSICNNWTYNVKYLSANNADLSMNCWCSTDENYLDLAIYDGYDNTAYGLVTYMPLLTVCDQPLIGIKEKAQTELNIKVYPNPFQDILLIETEEISMISLKIYDMMGRLILSDEFHGNTSISTSDLEHGMYTYVLTSESGTSSVGKIVKD